MKLHPIHRSHCRAHAAMPPCDSHVVQASEGPARRSCMQQRHPTAVALRAEITRDSSAAYARSSTIALHPTTPSPYGGCIVGLRTTWFVTAPPPSCDSSIIHEKVALRTRAGQAMALQLV